MADLDSLTLSAIIRSSDDAIITKTVDGLITSWNPAAERIFGYAAAEVIGRPITLLFPADRLPEEDEFLRRIRTGERVEHFETVRLRKDGSPIDVAVTLSPIADPEGRLLGISKIARDITERKRAEARRQAREELLRITLSSIGDAVLTTDTEGRVTFMNLVAETLTGWTSDAARGEPIERVFRIVNEKTGRAAEDPVGRVLGEGVVVGLANHTVLIARDGTARPIDDSAAPIHDDEGSLFGAVLVFHDVTERRRAEEGRQRLAAIVECSDDAILSKTLDGVVTSWNAGAERMFGYLAEEIVGRPITILIPPERLQEEADFLARLGRGDRVENFETVRVRRNGDRVHVSVALSPIKNEAGDIVGVSKIARDITERVRLAARERAARQEAEEANRLKDEFLAMLSHELRTPLNSIYGWTRMLRTGSLDPGTAARALDVIERNCRSQLELITELLDVSRIVTGRVALDLRNVDLADIVLVAADGVRPGAAARGITLEVLCDPDVPPVMGDPDRLQQVVWNLLSNAVKFTDHGGRVTVRVAQSGSKVSVTVQDTGIGIEPDVLPHIFERFRQADSSTSRRHGGLGLGLSIVRHLVQLHGGVVHAWSDGPGRGASFTVSLPVAAVRIAGGRRAEPDRSRAEGGRADLTAARVLVVDDDHDAQDLVAEVLRRAGATVVTASNAAEALRLLVAERPNVLVTDLGMPGEDGFRLIKGVRGLPDAEIARIPAVALTAYSRPADRQVALIAGFERYLPKPVEPAELVRVVGAMVHRG